MNYLFILLVAMLLPNTLDEQLLINQNSTSNSVNQSEYTTIDMSDCGQNTEIDDNDSKVCPSGCDHSCSCWKKTGNGKWNHIPGWDACPHHRGQHSLPLKGEIVLYFLVLIYAFIYLYKLFKL